MQESTNINDLIEKIEWEGGIAGALDYGFAEIDDYDVPDDLKDAWAEMSDVWDEFESQRMIVQELLNTYASKYETDKEF